MGRVTETGPWVRSAILGLCLHMKKPGLNAGLNGNNYCVSKRAQCRKMPAEHYGFCRHNPWEKQKILVISQHSSSTPQHQCHLQGVSEFPARSSVPQPPQEVANWPVYMQISNR